MNDRDWSDIAYQIAVDQAGRAWRLRGLTNRSGANGDETANSLYGAILLIVGSGESPTTALVETTRSVVADFRASYPRGTQIQPHSAVRPDPTDCPGDTIRKLIAAGAFDPRHTPTTPPEKKMTPQQMTELKNFIEQRVKAYSDRNAVNLRQQLVAIKTALQKIDDQVDASPIEPADLTAPAIES